MMEESFSTISRAGYSEEQNGPQWESQFNLLLPKLNTYLDFSQILKCRLVSKSWLLHIDQFFSDSNPKLQPYNEELHMSYPYPYLPSASMHEQFHFGTVMGRYRFYRTAHFNGFTKRMAVQLQNGRNPFIGRFVSVGLITKDIAQDPRLPLRTIPQYWINLEKFIRHWGQNIWYFQIGDDGATHTAKEFYLLIHRLLQNLPNLKLLDISSLHLDRSRKSTDTLENVIKDHPLPDLPNMESLLLPRSGSMPCQIQHTLVHAYARKLKNFRVGLASCGDDYQHVLTNLNELTVFRLESNEQLTGTLGLFTVPLKKLVLDVRTTTKITSWNTERILELLQDFPIEVAVLKFGNTVPLQETQIDSPIPLRDKFKAERLRYLEMTHSPETSYNFLWCLPSLKYLHIEYHPFVEGDMKGNLVKLLVGTASGIVAKDDQELDVREFIESGRDLYQSNVWGVVPTLEVLSYTRSHWFWSPKRFVYRRQYNDWKQNQIVTKNETTSQTKMEVEVKDVGQSQTKIEVKVEEADQGEKKIEVKVEEADQSEKKVEEKVEEADQSEKKIEMKVEAAGGAEVKQSGDLNQNQVSVNPSEESSSSLGSGSKELTINLRRLHSCLSIIDRHNKSQGILVLKTVSLTNRNLYSAFCLHNK